MPVQTDILIAARAMRTMKSCSACLGCSKVRSSAQCEHKCERWFSLRVKELSYASERVGTPNFV